MNRRAFIAGLGGVVAWPLVALTKATAAKSFTIAYLALLPDEDRMSFMARFMRRLAELGYNDGQNLRGGRLGCVGYGPESEQSYP